MGADQRPGNDAFAQEHGLRVGNRLFKRVSNSNLTMLLVVAPVVKTDCFGELTSLCGFFRRRKYIQDKNSPILEESSPSFDCAVMAHLTDKVDHPTLCGPIVRNFSDCAELVVTSAVLSWHSETGCDIYASTGVIPNDGPLDEDTRLARTGSTGNMNSCYEDRFHGQQAGAGPQNAGPSPKRNYPALFAHIDSDSNGEISRFVCPKHISLEAKSFSPAAKEPFGVWVNDDFLEKHDLHYGDFVACWDAEGQYHWDCLKKSVRLGVGPCRLDVVC